MNERAAQVSEAIECQRARVAEAVVERQFALDPALEQRYGKVGRQRCLEDALFHLAFLAESIAVDQVSLFVDYIVWARALLASYRIPVNDLQRNLLTLQDVLHEHLPDGTAFETVERWIAAALQELETPTDPTSAVVKRDLQELAERYLNALLSGDRHTAARLILDAVQSGASIRSLYRDVFQETQYEIGRLWQTNRITVAQEHFCTAATQLIMAQLYPYVFSTPKHRGTVVATSVGGELHELGIRMVADLLEMEGWDCFYLGANTPSSSIIASLRERNASALAVSVTMAFHLGRAATLIADVRRALPDVKIIVGGRPFNLVPDLWHQIGADAYAPDAESTVDVLDRLLAGE